jgi:hypothetical protein
MKYSKIFTGLAVVLVACFAMQGAQAACPGNPLLNTSGSGIHWAGWPSGSAVCYDFGCYEAPFSPNATGVFWALGAGAGNNSGPYTSDQWLNSNSYNNAGTYFYFPGGNISTSWNAAANIPGCVYANPPNPGQECTCILITDQDANGNGLFAAMGARGDNLGNTSFELPGLAPLALEALPAPRVISSTRNPGTNNLDTMTITVDPPSGGVYAKDGCNCGPVSYKLVAQLLPRAAAAPVDRSTGWNPLPLAGGAMQGDTNIGATVDVSSMCGASDTNLWIAADVTFDSGFGSSVVSTNGTRIECGPNLANPIEGKPGRPGSRDLAPRNQREGRTGGR